MKKIAVLGATGSIGRSALSVVRAFPDAFQVYALSTNSNITLLLKQINEFHPRIVCVGSSQAARELAGGLHKEKPKILIAEEGLLEIVSAPVDTILMGISTSAALKPLLRAIDCGKTVALANKEALVMAGTLLMQRLASSNARIIPIDSEQSAIWQCLQGEDIRKVRTIYLTASGGPFLDTPKEKFAHVSIRKVIQHPRWSMGKKISVDSATLVNKGLEVLEAMFLFSLPSQQIKVLVHPESIIHSMVEFVDGVVMAQLSATDMRIPIQYALTYPARLANHLRGIDFYGLRSLNFQKPDLKKFPALRLAYWAAEELGTLPCVFNSANEVCVEMFLRKSLPFIAIPNVIAKVMEQHQNNKKPNLEEIFAADSWAREKAAKVIAGLR